MTTISPTAGSRTANSQANGFSALSSEEFTKIIISELSNQDPMQPSDTNALLQQLSNIRNIQSSMDLSEKLKSLVSENQLASASNMIGKVAGGLAEDNTRTFGRVISISKTGDGVFLNLFNGARVSVNKLDGLIDPAELTDAEKALAGVTKP